MNIVLDRPHAGPTTRQATVTVIACGAPDRADDGAASAAVAMLDPMALVGIRLRVVNHLRVEELIDAASLGPVVVADAAVGLRPGLIAALPFTSLVSVAGRVHLRSSHEMPIADAVGLAEMLLGRPIDGAVVAVGVGSVAHGAPFSEPVRAALRGFGLAIVRAARSAALARTAGRTRGER